MVNKSQRSNHLQKSSDRKDQILQTLAEMLEYPHRMKITVAALAERLEISESSVYRCFPSKSEMFGALIEFIEKTLFVLVNKIQQEESSGVKQIENLLLLLMGFSQKNPGMTRILIGDVLVNENEHLQIRINQLHDRLEATLKQALRFAISEGKISERIDAAAYANLLMCFVVGCWHQFVKSEFNRSPLAGWEIQRLVLLPASIE